MAANTSTGSAAEWKSALAELLALFAETRSARVAELVGRVSVEAEKGLAPIAGKNLATKKDAAIALVEAGDPRDIPRVLRLLRELRMEQARALVDALANIPPEPRLHDALMPLLRDPPFSSSSSMSFWRAFVKVVDAQRDPRTRPALEALDFSWLPEWSAETFRSICGRLKKLEGASPAPRPLDADGEAICRRIEVLLESQVSGPTLLAAIRANPADDTARAVWADWLEAQGDPRGTFVSLSLKAERESLSDAEQKTLRALLDEHGKAWLGDLAGVLELDNVKFRRGLLSHARLTTGELERVVVSEHASTLEWLYLFPRGGFGPALLRKLPALSFVGGIEPPMLDALEAAGPFQLEGLGIDLYDVIPSREREWTAEQRELRERFTRLRRTFPRLTELAVRAWYKDAEELVPFLTSPLVEGVRTLRLSGAGSSASWFKERDRLPAELSLLEVSFDFGFHGWQTELALRPDGVAMVATLRPSQQSFATSKLEEIVKTLDEFPTDALTSLEVRADGVRVQKTALEAIARAASRHARLGALTLPGRGTVRPSFTPDTKTDQERARERYAAEAAAALRKIGALVGEELDLELGPARSFARLEALLGRVDKALAVELAIALVALPVPSELRGEPRAAHEALVNAALLVVASSERSDKFTCLRASLEGWPRVYFKRVFTDHHELVGAGELPLFLDWFETLAVSEMGVFHYAVRALLLERDTPLVRAELERRVGEHKLNRFHRWTYDLTSG